MSKNLEKKSLKIQLAQINFVVGDIQGNFEKIIKEYEVANLQNCDLVVFSEMAICGYPCEDLWLKEHFIKKCQEKILEIATKTKDKNCAILFGAPIYETEKNKKVLRNSAILIENGEVKNVINKKTLPSYGVFDENRYFRPSAYISNIEFRNFDVVILICEDLWDERNLFLLGEQVFDFIISINASPFEKNKNQQRSIIAQKYSQTLKKPLIYVNQIGGQDSLVFDGASFVLDNQGSTALQMANFIEDSAQISIDKKSKIEIISHHQKTFGFVDDNIEKNYQASVLSLRDYVHKNNFHKIILGMSGGIDSALVATIAVDALGSENVELYALPTKFNAQSSLDDAKLCAKNLQVALKIIEIEEIFQTNLKILKTHETISSLAQENLQSRIRGNILMAISNSKNALLMSTGNKSEMACGYATLYGDMNGAFNPIKDFYKTEIYQLANFRNQNLCKISDFKNINLIPQNIIDKAPSAELRFDQKDSDSLPDYNELDKILYALIEEQKSIDETINLGFEAEVVKKVAKLVSVSEYKRKQAVLGVKISQLSFDKDRRYPITNKFIF
jgi:NAD+ synthase